MSELTRRSTPNGSAARGWSVVQSAYPELGAWAWSAWCDEHGRSGIAPTKDAGRELATRALSEMQDAARRRTVRRV